MLALKIQDLTKTYANGNVALKGINLRVEEGDFFALLGPNGAGKSTTIGIITSLVNKTSGTINVFGFDMDTHLAQAKSCIGVVPQEFNFNMFETVLQIVVNQAGYYGVPRRLALSRAEQYLTQLGLWEKRHQSARMLSGGMKRRLMIARALIHEPRLLILDEPTAGVDIELRRSLWTFIRDINRNGTTVILTTHYLEEAESLCRNIAIIDRGVMIENKSMRELLQTLRQETLILYSQSKLIEEPRLENFSSRLIDETTLEVDLKAGELLGDLFGQLSKQGIQITGMRNKTNRLEELFLSLTARQ